MGQAIRQKSFSRSELLECSEFLEYIYINEDDCYVRVLSKERGGKYKVYPINSLKEPMKLRQVLNSFPREDLFMSLNPFRTMDKSTRSNLFCINAIPIDIDYRSIKEFKKLEPLQVIKLLEMDFFDVKIPIPNFIEYGNQIRLIYSIETCYIPKNRDNVVTLARRISEVFAKELKEYGAAKQNLESYFRVPGSINTKNGSQVKILSYDEAIRYTLRELQELWLDELPVWYKKRRGRVKTPNKVIKIHNVYTLNMNRLIDFELIQAYLNNIGETNLRARLCFLYRNYVLIKNKYQNGQLKLEDYEYAREEMLKFNSKFNDPLRENVIESATRVVNYRQYLYKNETLIDFLELDYDLCEKLDLKSIYKTKSKKEINDAYYSKNKERIIEKVKDNYKNKYKDKYKEKYEDNKEKCKEKYKNKLIEQGRVSKKEELNLLREKIKTFKSEGFRNDEIALKLNIPLKTLERHITYMRKNGLLQ